MNLDYRYACCVHCEITDVGEDGDFDEPINHVDGHIAPCPEGCNDGEGAP